MTKLFDHRMDLGRFFAKISGVLLFVYCSLRLTGYEGPVADELVLLLSGVALLLAYLELLGVRTALCDLGNELVDNMIAYNVVLFLGIEAATGEIVTGFNWGRGLSRAATF